MSVLLIAPAVSAQTWTTVDSWNDEFTNGYYASWTQADAWTENFSSYVPQWHTVDHWADNFRLYAPQWMTADTWQSQIVTEYNEWINADSWSVSFGLKDWATVDSWGRYFTTSETTTKTYSSTEPFAYGHNSLEGRDAIYSTARTTYFMSSSSLSIGQGIPSDYQVHRTFLLFDVSELSDYTLIGGKLKLTGVVDDSIYSEFDIEVRGFTPDTLAANNTSYNGYGSTVFGTISSTDYSSLSDDMVITLNSDGINYIKNNIGDSLIFVLVSDRDMNAIAPTGGERIDIAKPSSANPPHLSLDVIPKPGWKTADSWSESIEQEIHEWVTADSLSIGIIDEYLPDNLKNGLVLWYEFDENNGTTVYDLSGNTNNGTLYNFTDTSPGAGDTGDSGWLSDGGLRFDGVDDYVIVPNHDSINFISEMGIFIRAKILSSSAEVRQLAGKYHYNYYTSRINNDIFQFTTNHTNGTTDSYSDTLSGYTLDVNKLYDLYCDYSQSRGDKRLYVDGNLKKIDNTANNGGDLSEYYLKPNTEPLYIGMYPDYTYSDIVIEKIIIYDRALSEDEVAELHDISTPPEWITVDSWNNSIEQAERSFVTVDEWTTGFKRVLLGVEPGEPMLPYDDIISKMLLPLMLLFVPAFVLGAQYKAGGLVVGLMLGTILMYLGSDISLGYVILILLGLGAVWYNMR